MFRDELWPDFTREAFEASLDGVRGAAAPVRGPVGMAARRRAAGQGSDLAPRIVVAIPAIVFALFIVDQGGEVFAVGLFALGRRRAGRAVHADGRACGRRRSRAS